MKNENYYMVIENKHRPGVDVDKALDVYETFHHLTREDSWGKVPWPCTCPTSHAHCVCKHGPLLAALFDPEIKVLAEYVGAEPADRKKCKRMKGTAGPKRMRLLAEQSSDKKNTVSKIQFLDMQGCGAVPSDVVIPEVTLPSSSESSEEEVQCMSCPSLLLVLTCCKGPTPSQP